MAMTTSDNDHEALAALRKANEVIKGEKLTWQDVLSQDSGRTINLTLHRTAPAPYQTDENWVAPHLKDKVTIDLMFRCIYAQPRGTNEEFWQFVDSVHNRWQKHGNLTQGQYAAIKNSYLRTVRASAS